MKNQLRRGFTLMELLVVIGLIAMLAAFLFPVFAQAREKARQCRCINNLRQIAVAMLMYDQDNDMLLPPVLTHPSDQEPLYPTTWMARLQPYVHSTAIFVDASSGHSSTDWQRSGDLMR